MLIASESLTGDVLYAVQLLSTIASCSNANTNLAQQQSINVTSRATNLAISSWLHHWLRCCLSFCSSLAFVITCLGSSIPCSDTPRSADDHETLCYGTNSEVHSKIGVKLASRSWLPMQCQSCWKLHWHSMMLKAQHWTSFWLVCGSRYNKQTDS